MQQESPTSKNNDNDIDEVDTTCSLQRGKERADNHQDQEQIPPDVWLQILNYLSPNELSNKVCMLNTKFYKLGSDDYLWKPRCLQRWEGKQNVTNSYKTDGIIPTHVLSWKERFCILEMDSQRQTIKREEVSYYRWKLIYQGFPSRMGLRYFHYDGTYESPYLGLCLWELDEENNTLTFGGMQSLNIERNPENWGWIIGKGTSTVYHSVEV